MVFRGVDGTGMLFVVGVGLLAGSLVDRPRSGGDRVQLLRAAGWACLSLYWGVVGIGRIDDGFVFLGTTASIVSALCLYATTISVRERALSGPLTEAFVGMGLAYIPFEYIEPLHRFGLEIVTRHTAFVVRRFGTDAAIDVGAAGYNNVLVFSNPVSDGVLQASIISACTGISAIALFGGLVSVSTASFQTKCRSLLVLIPAIYALNIVRNVFTVMTYANHSFSILESVPVVGDGVETDPYFSYIVAEQVVAPLYIVGGVIIVYYLISRRLPGIRELFLELLDTIETDRKRVGL